MDLDAELAEARDLDVSALADAIQNIGFDCTRCGACCKGHGSDQTATIFPDEVRAIRDGDETPADYDWRDVARPMPFGLSAGSEDPSALEGETFEWALVVDSCGDCTFYDDGEPDEPGACRIYGDRPLICRTYPFSVDLGGAEPMGKVVDTAGVVRAHECEGLGRDIERSDALALARTLKERAITELEELGAVRDAYDPVETEPGEVVVHDSEGPKHPDGTPL